MNCKNEKWSVRKKMVLAFACVSLGIINSAEAADIIQNNNIQANVTGGPNFKGLLSINLKENERPAAYTLDIANPTDPAYTKDSSVHLSYDGQDTGGWITSVGPNNFWLSSGTAYDGVTSRWILKSPISGCSSMYGSGDSGFRIFMQCGSPTNTNSAITPVIAMRIKHDSSTDKSSTVELRGGLQLNTAIDTNVDYANGVHAIPAEKPACDTTKAGTFWYTRGASGVKDSVEICAKYADESFGWRSLSF